MAKEDATLAASVVTGKWGSKLIKSEVICVASHDEVVPTEEATSGVTSVGSTLSIEETTSSIASAGAAALVEEASVPNASLEARVGDGNPT